MLGGEVVYQVQNQFSGLWHAFKQYTLAVVILLVLVIWGLVAWAWTEPYMYKYQRHIKGVSVHGNCSAELPASGSADPAKSGMSDLGKSLLDDGREIQTSFCTQAILYDGQTGSDARGSLDKYMKSGFGGRKSGLSDSALRATSLQGQ